MPEHNYPISRYLNVRQAFWPSFTSDGGQVVFLSDITGVPQVWRVGLGERMTAPLWPEQLTFEADRVMGVWPSPVPGDGRLIYARDVGGNENAQLYLLSAAGGPEVCLTAGHEKAMHLFGEWSEDGQRILFAANRRHPGLFDLYLGTLDGDAERVWENDAPGYLYNQAFSPDGRRAVLTRAASSFHHDLFEVHLQAGTATALLASEEDIRVAACEYAPDGDSLLLITDLGSDFLYLARLDLGSGKLERLATPNWDCEGMALAPDGHTLAYAVNVEGVHEIHLLDLATGQGRQVPTGGAVPGLIPDERLAFAPDSTRLAFAYTSAVRSADIHVWGVATDQVHAVTRSAHGGIPVDSFVAPTLIHYPTFDREATGEVRQIPAWFYEPAMEGHGPVPAVVVVHGGPEGQFRPAFHFFVQYLVHRGYAVLAPNVRGSTGYGKTYSHLDDVERRMDSVADLAHAAHWLREQPGVDGERLAVYGGSYGGFMVLSALTAYPNLWAAGVDLVGISNLATFLENTSDYRRAHREAEYGSLSHDRAFLERIAPIRHVDRIVAPLMVIHGANDPRVPLSEAGQLVKALRERDVPVEFIVFDDEGHGLVKLKNKLVAYPAIGAFLDRHLQ